MNSPREEIIGSAVAASGLPGTFAHTLVHEAPWLTCEDEISEEIGQKLLAPLAEQHQLEKGSIVQFLNELNSLVRARIGQGYRARAQAFEALSEELSRHGTEAEYEDGDYWLQADDLDIGCVFVEMLGDFRLSDAALENLRGVFERHSQTIRTIRIRSAKGTAVIAIPPQRRLTPRSRGEAQQPATLRCMWYFPLRVAVCRPRLSSNVRRTQILHPQSGA